MLECDGFRSIIFYRDRLGLKLTRRFEVKENNTEIAFLEDPDGNAVELRDSCARGGPSQSLAIAAEVFLFVHQVSVR